MGEIFKFPVSVHLILKGADGILLMRRKNTGFCDGYYSLPSGKLVPNEPLDLATIREANEELNIKLGRETLRPVVIMHRKGDDADRIDAFFYSDSWDGVITNNEPEKCDDLRWCEIDALPQNTIPYIRDVLVQFSMDIKLLYFGWQ